MTSNLRWQAARASVGAQLNALENLEGLPNEVYKCLFGSFYNTQTHNLFTDTGNEILVTNQVPIGTMPLTYGALLTLSTKKFPIVIEGDRIIIEEDRGLRLFQIIRMKLLSMGKNYNDLFVIVADLGEAKCD